MLEPDIFKALEEEGGEEEEGEGESFSFSFVCLFVCLFVCFCSFVLLRLLNPWTVSAIPIRTTKMEKMAFS